MFSVILVYFSVDSFHLFGNYPSV